MSTDTATEQITTFANELDYEDLRPETERWAKRCLLDAIGCALGAVEERPIEILQRMTRDVNSNRPARVLGTDIDTHPDLAALATGTAIRYLDFSDDYIVNDGPHPSDTLGAVLAVADSIGATGKEVLTATTVAYEVVCRMVDAVAFRPGWDYVLDTAMGSSMAAGNLQGLSKEELEQALALAIVPNCALGQSRTGELSMWKGAAGPNAARNGVFAAELAAKGMTGPSQPIEGEQGLQAQITGPFELAPFGGDGRPFKIEETWFKYLPTMYPFQTPVLAALELYGRIDPAAIDSIVVGMNADPYQVDIEEKDYTPQTRETADHSLPYCVAAALIDGEFTLESYEPDRLQDPAILELARKISSERVYTDEYPEMLYACLEVTMESGETIVEELRDPKGHPANPMTDEELEAKFHNLVGEHFTADEERRIVDRIWNIETEDDIGPLLRECGIKD